MAVAKASLDKRLHVGKYAKNTDEDDVSLFQGRSYIPEDQAYQAYLRALPKSADAEKATCSYLKALNKGDRKKFKNMEITGVIHVQCPHVFIQSSVDLQLGERFGNSDYALAHAIRQYPDRQLDPSSESSPGWITTCNDFVSYDIACAYSTNIEDRFKVSFPDLVPAIERLRWLIPLVHVQNHKDDCMYRYACSYNKHAGHQHGETCEVYWAESNQLGGQVRQMNNGHRQDTLIINHSDWNQRKTVIMPDILYDQIIEAKELLARHLEHFQTLTQLYANFLPEWEILRAKLGGDESELRRGRSTAEVKSVYRHNTKSVPSQAKAFQYLKSLTADQPHARSTRSSGTSVSDHAIFINDGLEIEALQRKILSQVAALDKDQSDTALKKEISDRRGKLRKRLDQWRGQQKTMTPALGNHVVQQRAKAGSNCPESENISLPSSFSHTERLRLGLVELANTEQLLREGAIYDALRDIQNIVKVLAILYNHKPKEAYGQARNTRANAKIYSAQAELNLLITHYNVSRDAYINLNASDASDEKRDIFKPLTLKDTYRKPTHEKRKIGDSRKFDGLGFRVSGAANSGVLAPSKPDANGVESQQALEEVLVGTRMTKAKKRKANATRNRKKGTKRNGKNGTKASESQEEEQESEAPPREDGWIWRLETMTNMNSREIEEWAKEGNRVQWFRAEAEVERWEEQLEISQGELKRTIATFDTMKNVWRTLAEVFQEAQPGHAAYGRKKSDAYAKLACHARKRAVDSGFGERLIPEQSKKASLAEYVAEDRAQKRERLHELGYDKGSGSKLLAAALSEEPGGDHTQE